MKTLYLISTITVLILARRIILHLFLGPFACYMSKGEIIPHWAILLYAFKHKHPIRLYYGEHEQSLIAACVYTLIKEKYPLLSEEDVITFPETLISRKNALVRWFWNLK